MKRGYLALWRKIQDHPFYKERRVFSKYEAWIDLLMNAQHEIEPKKVTLGMNVLTQNYGECLKSNVTWAKRWGWSEHKVRRFTKLLKKMGQIERKSEGITSRISILNYEQYDPKRRNCVDGPSRGRRDPVESPSTNKNVKNVKNGKNKEELEKLKGNGIWFNEKIWNNFLEHRIKLKSPMTIEAEILALKKLNKFQDRGLDPIEIINEAIIAGWKNFYPPKESQNKTDIQEWIENA